MDIREYCDALNLELTVIYYPNQGGRFCAMINNVEIMRNGVLESPHGNGRTYREAVLKYAQYLIGKRITVNAFKPDRAEYVVPEILTVGDL